MSIKNGVPNGITLLNLFSGCIAVYFAAIDELVLASIFTLLGIFFDFFDGFFARILKVQSELGKQLDSLADMITSGMVPGMFMFQMLKKSHLIESFFPVSLPSSYWVDYIPLLGFVITVASGYRLAKFNIDTRQTSSFIGLPTPANTLFIISLGLIGYFYPENIMAKWILNTYLLFGVIVLSSFLLNCEIHLFALKFNDWTFKNNWFRYLIILISLLSIFFLGYIGVLIAIIFYILLSIIIKEIS